MVQVRDRHGERVSSVIRLRDARQTKQQLHHALHLLLISLSVARHRLLDLQRRVFRDGQPRLVEREQHHAARLPHAHRGARVRGEEQRLDRGSVWLPRCDERLKLLVQRCQPLREWLTFWRFDHAVGERLERAIAPFVHHAVAARRQTGVNA